MTPEQKQAIEALRQDGLGYKTISDRLSLSVNTVKSYCHRQGLKAQNKTTDKLLREYCPVCAKELHHIVGKKKKRFCSDTCRMIWWNNHQDQIQKKNFTEAICSFCQKSFTFYGNKTRRYCSHQCYITDRFGGKGDSKTLS